MPTKTENLPQRHFPTSVSPGSNGDPSPYPDTEEPEIISPSFPVPLKAPREYRRSDFAFGSLLGAGAFSHVVHARDFVTGNEHALKILDKKHVEVQGKVQSVLNEKNMLQSLSHPSVVRLDFTFQDEACLYFGLELCENGNLAEFIERRGNPGLDLELVRFYTAELAAALSYLRSCGVVHRDLKPDNILISQGGHLKLADFDSAKRVSSSLPVRDTAFRRRNTFVGTAQYVSPEMIADSPDASYGPDLWALGCVLVQMLTGEPPFRDPDQDTLFGLISAAEFAFEDSSHLDLSACDLARQLLRKNPVERCGYANIEDIKNHNFLKCVDFSSLYLSAPTGFKVESPHDDCESDDESDLDATPMVGQAFGGGGRACVDTLCHRQCREVQPQQQQQQSRRRSSKPDQTGKLGDASSSSAPGNPRSEDIGQSDTSGGLSGPLSFFTKWAETAAVWRLSLHYWRG